MSVWSQVASLKLLLREIHERSSVSSGACIPGSRRTLAGSSRNGHDVRPPVAVSRLSFSPDAASRYCMTWATESRYEDRVSHSRGSIARELMTAISWRWGNAYATGSS